MTFGGTPAASYTVNSPTQITAFSRPQRRARCTFGDRAGGNSNTARPTHLHDMVRHDQTESARLSGTWETYVKTALLGRQLRPLEHERGLGHHHFTAPAWTGSP